MDWYSFGWFYQCHRKNYFKAWSTDFSMSILSRGSFSILWAVIPLSSFSSSSIVIWHLFACFLLILSIYCLKSLVDSNFNLLSSNPVFSFIFELNWNLRKFWFSPTIPCHCTRLTTHCIRTCWLWFILDMYPSSFSALNSYFCETCLIIVNCKILNAF